MRLVAAFACAAILICLGGRSGHAETRVALVIGNAAYRNVAALPNPVNDASDIALSLRGLGFRVTELPNASFDRMRRGLIEFGRQARGADMAVLFFAGHGMEIGGDNWLIPVDAELRTDTDAEAEAISLRFAMGQVSGATRLGLVVLDACRNNPFAAKMQRTSRWRAVERGLSRIEPATDNVAVVYAAKDGTTADDGNGRNSPFTAALLKYLGTPGLDIRFLFASVRDDVIAATHGQQQPFIYQSLPRAELYLVPPAAAPTAGPATPPSFDLAAQAWAVTKDTTSQAVLDDFIRQFGATVYGSMARARLEELKRGRVAAVAPAAVPSQPPVAEPAQRVVLYEEDPQDSAGKRYVGSVAWHSEIVSPGAGQPPEMMVRADIEIPERKMAMRWSLRRNSDKTLPASHTIELMFRLPSDFPHGGVQNVPGVLLKDSEQTRGVPMAGLSVKVTAGFFLVGLSAVEAEMMRNIQLLKERTWIDIRIVYNDGRRAILAVEKGLPGARAFNTAFAAWHEMESKTNRIAAVAPPVVPIAPSGPCAAGPTTASLSSRAACPLSDTEERALKPKDVFKECDQCPEMVVVPAGNFMMGSPASEQDRGSNQGPQRYVKVARQFAAGRFAVTFDEWDACAADGGCNAYRPSDQGWGRGRRPVINVSWNDAQAYVAWLSRRTGKTYRLLSEAERDYVARAGKTTPFWWGASIATRQVDDGNRIHKGDANGEYLGRTLPVDAFEPNRWGIYQAHGNVWEWVEDCWHESYAGAPLESSAWTAGDCGRRVLRGEAWNSSPRYFRSASRDGFAPDLRVSGFGFRLARPF